MTGRRDAMLKFVKLTENAFSPIKQSSKAAGYDLRSAYDIIVPPHGKGLVKLDIKVQLPEGCYGRIAPRSGLALNHHIDIGAGVIDEDYRGNVGVVVFNHSDKEFVVKRGDRIAQLICEQILHPELQEVQGRVLHPKQSRVMSVREFARVQGFCYSFIFCGSMADKYCQVGNAVPPPLSAAIGHEIGKCLIINKTRASH